MGARSANKHETTYGQLERNVPYSEIDGFDSFTFDAVCERRNKESLLGLPRFECKRQSLDTIDKF